MHRGYYPLVDNQPMKTARASAARGRRRPSRAGRPSTDNRHPMDKAIEHSRRRSRSSRRSGRRGRPRCSPAAACRPLGGHRLYVPGKGPVFGEMTVTADAGERRTAFATDDDANHRADRRNGHRAPARRSSTPASSGAAAASRPAKPDDVVARGDVRRSRLAARCAGRWFTGALRRDRASTSRCVRLGADPVVLGTERSCASKTGRDSASAADLRRQPAGDVSRRPTSVSARASR